MTVEVQAMRRVSTSIIVPYLISIALIFLITGAFYLLNIENDTPIVALLYLLPVGLSTALWGLGPGIACAVSAFFVFNYYFIQPTYTLTVHQPQDVLALIVFLVVAIVISQLVGRAKLNLATANTREHEASQLYDLGTLLSASHDDGSIARGLAYKVSQTFQADRVGVSLETRLASQALLIVEPHTSTSPIGKPTIIVPLMTARGLQGEIRVWRKEPLSMGEERLLQTFATQGGLSLDRSRLAQAETRAKVLEESDRLKSALLSSVSHELRTPLATIKASISSLRSETVDWDSAARHDLLAAIEEETDYLNQLVGNLLDMSRIEAGALNPQKKWNSLAEIVGSVLSRMRSAAQEHRLEIDLSDDLPLVLVDYVQLAQVFSNLISNSLKYAPIQSTIKISARVKPDRSIQIEVINQGPPVPAEHLDRIFDKFYRVTAADRVTGTGLGLSICKGMIEAHGGRIWAENRPEGFAFVFMLPAESVNQPKMPIEKEAS
ncbi:MAG TPA: ATP-binding protein [Anaerolineae bacterium]|nr:ATP-binding protein [Anaerolineae bacterium]